MSRRWIWGVVSPVVAVALGADRDVEVDQVVRVVRLPLAQVPLDAGAAEHDAAEAVVERVLGGDDAHVDRAVQPDAVVGQQVLRLVQALAEAAREVVNVVEQAQREVERDAARADVGGVHARSGDALVELHQLLALLEQPEERSHRAHVEGVRSDGHYMVQNPSDLGEQGCKRQTD